MSNFKSELEIFDGLMENVSSQIARDPSKVITESISVKNTKASLDESANKRKKDFQKKKMDLIGKKKIVLDAKKVLKGLYESVIGDNGYSIDAEAKIAFYEACISVSKALTEMDDSIGGDLGKAHDLYKKYFNGGDISDEEMAFLKSKDDNLDINSPSTNSTFQVDEKKKLTNPNSL